MNELYQLPPGQDVAPGLPPVDLPVTGAPPRAPLRITVSKAPQPQIPLPPQRSMQRLDDPATTGFVPFDPNKATSETTARSADNPTAAGFSPFNPNEEPPAEGPKRSVGGGEAALTGFAHGATFGFAPAIGGMLEAGKNNPDLANYVQEHGIDPKDVHVSEHVKVAMSAAKMLGDWMMGTSDPEIHAAYEKGRKHALENEELAKEQHPVAYMSGQLAGTVAVPGLGAMRAAGTGGRVAQGIVQGGIAGGLTGAGEATSEGKPIGQIARDAAIGGAIGAPLGGAIGGAFGPRIVNPNSAGQRAARTAQDLGAPIPRGLASDSRVIQNTTAKVGSLPLIGDRIGQQVHRTGEAAGESLEGISGAMTGGATGRAAADTMVRPGLQSVIDSNRTAIDAAYNNVRSLVNQTQRYTMPRTDAALNRIMAARNAAGHVNPAQGLEQFRNVAGGATFNGAHRARVDAREAGNALVPHPGYNAGDFNQLTRAMTADLREMVQAGSRDPRRALTAFDQAEQNFGRLADQNNILHRLVNAKGEGAIGTLLGAAKEKGGNLRLLTQLRSSMPPQEFQNIGGTLLHELGHNTATNEFSLAKFATEWGKISQGAKRALFAPAHLDHIENVADLGTHIKGALRQANTSHSGSVLVIFDLAKDVALLAHDMATGGLGGIGTLVGAGTTAPMLIFAHWLASPAKAASMSAWSTAYRGILGPNPTPARRALFKVATRNLANNLGVPADRIMKLVASHTAEADVDSGNNE